MDILLRSEKGDPSSGDLQLTIAMTLQSPLWHGSRVHQNISNGWMSCSLGELFLKIT